MTSFETRAQIVLAILQQKGLLPVSEIRAQLRISQPTLARLMASLRGRVVQIGRTRTSRYGLCREVNGLKNPIPVYVVGEEGSVQETANLWPIHGGSWWQAKGPAGSGYLHEGLPYYFEDMRPQGFIGRTFASRNQDLKLPMNTQAFNGDQIAAAIARRTEDSVGNLVVGSESVERLFQLRRLSAPPVSQAQKAATYPKLAERILTDPQPGSSAGGEQPKFPAWVETPSGPSHVLVKFANRDNGPVSNRWADLLICEELAHSTLREAGKAAANCTIIESGSMVFLESIRFDRIGALGRKGVLTLQAAELAFGVNAGNWVDSIKALLEAKAISQVTAHEAWWLDAFCRRIGHSDRHSGNLSFFADCNDGAPLLRSLAPAYDLAPMHFKPFHDCVVAPAKLSIIPHPLAIPEWEATQTTTNTYWDAVCNDSRISKPFRETVLKPERALKCSN